MSNRCSRTPAESSSMTEEDVRMNGRLKPIFGKALKSSAIEVQGNVTSRRSSLKSKRDEDKQGETARMSSKRKRIKESNPIKYDNNLLGSKVKVLWPEDEKFYEGVIVSFDYAKKKHRVYYANGESEILNLRKVRWEIIGDDLVSDGDADVKHSSHDTSSLAKPVEAAKSLDKESNPIKYGNNLVGSKVKVWWPKDGTFYDGVIASFDNAKKKHVVYYTDGDEELLDLRGERWEFVGDYSVPDGDAEFEHSCPESNTSSDAQRKKKKKRNTNSESSKRRKISKFQMNSSASHSSNKPVVLACEYEGDSGKISGGKSKDDGMPESEINVNNSMPESNYAAIIPRKLGDKSQGNRYNDDSAKTPSHPTEQDSQISSPVSKGKTPQSGNTPTKATPSPMVNKSGKTLPITASASKDGEGNCIWPTEGTLLHQATQSTLRRFSRTLIEGIHSDVTIITSDGSLKSHKSILSACSPVFHIMFKDDLWEKVSTVEMKELTSESCMALLSFLYGSLSQEAFLRHRLDLLGVASKYDIVDLKEACEQSLLEDIDSGNVIERLRQAWLYKLDKLKKGSSTYLLDHEKTCDLREVMNEFFIRADEGMLVEMFREVLEGWKQS